MDRNTLLRWVAIAGGLALVYFFILPKFNGSGDKGQSVPEEKYENAPGFVPDPIDPRASPDKPNEPAERELCKIAGNRFEAVLSSRGAGLKHLTLTDKNYDNLDLESASRNGVGPDVERWRSLRTLIRGPEGADQTKYDRYNWQLERGADGKSCTFTYQDELVRQVKVVSANVRPFELDVKTTVTNLAAAPKKHQLSIGIFSFRTNSEVKGSLGRVSPFETELSCASGKDVVRKKKDEFKSGWFAVPTVDRYAAVNSHYFTQALAPIGAEQPRCEILAEEWVTGGQARDADDAGAVYHAKLVYPGKELAPQASVTYEQIAFFGPKDRILLATATGSDRLKDVINLGFFTPVARVLVGVLVFFHDHITFGNWGLAIIAMTLCLRLLLFPLTLKSIKTTIAMRRLKPEVDSINAKFADDAQAKNLAMMELWKKHGVNPFGGCLPQLVQMPVWFAMYSTLQTAAEMYHTKFLWFADMSAPDKYYVLPLLLGVFMIVQQRVVPQQGMDPVQQKMMMYMLPAVFTVMMLFLPAALGVYMLTNSILGIAQQLIVEQIAPRDKGEILVVQKDGKGPKKPSGEGFGKGKARV